MAMAPASASGAMARSQARTISSRYSCGVWEPMSAPRQRLGEQVNDDRAGQQLDGQDRVHRPQSPCLHLVAQVVDQVGQSARHAVSHALGGVRITFQQFEHHPQQQANAVVHRVSDRLRDRGNHVVRVAVGMASKTSATGSHGENTRINSSNNADLPGNNR